MNKVDSILKMVTNQLIIKKSTFITQLYPVAFMKDIEHILQHVRKTNPDASHYCYGYILGEDAEVQKYSDDGEPSQTAGFPIMNVLKKQSLTNILCVVIRYYGGIKLGAGGLVRAYTKSTSEALKIATRVSPQAMVSVQIKTTFAASGSVEAFLRDNATITESIYEDVVTFIIEVSKDDYDLIESRVRDLTSANAECSITQEYTRYR